MILKPCKKAYKNETQRTTSPEETLARVEKALPAAGITRVADITNLDRIGIPVFSSIRPTAGRGAISVYNGKGATPTEARVSAMMEGIERFSAEPVGADLLIESYSILCFAHFKENKRRETITPGEPCLLNKIKNPRLGIVCSRIASR